MLPTGTTIRAKTQEDHQEKRRKNQDLETYAEEEEDEDSIYEDQDIQNHHDPLENRSSQA